MEEQLAAAAQHAGCELQPLPNVQTYGSILGGSREGQMLLVRASNSAAAPQGLQWSAGNEPALTHPGLRGCVRRALGLGARLFVDTSLGQRPQAYSSQAAFLSAVGGYYNVEGSRVAMAPDCNWGELVHELTHLAFDKRVRVSSQPDCERDPLRTHWRALCARGYSERCAEELLCREHEMHTLCAAAPWTRLTRTWVLWDSALVEASRDLQAVPVAERTQLQGRELRRILRLRTYVTGPVARLTHLLLAGGVAACLATGASTALTGLMRGISGPASAST